MHVKRVSLRSFKRFTELIVEDLPATARLIVLAGANGNGKSSLLEAFNQWKQLVNLANDKTYFPKVSGTSVPWNATVEVEFHEGTPQDDDSKKRAFYVRSAYRNEANFVVEELKRVGSTLDAPRVARLTMNDATVSGNYQRMASLMLRDLNNPANEDNVSRVELRDRYVGTIRTSMGKVFPNFAVEGIGDPLDNGSFFFTKGVSKGFRYENLSGGEKAAFDLLLDIVVKREDFFDSVYCIDEPETHMNTRLQADLLGELFALVLDSCQLWIATHSIGMMKKARDLSEAYPGQVVFLDFDNHDFDRAVTLRPVNVDREYWSRTLKVALGDLAALVAPSQVVLCEGRPLDGQNDYKAEFDAKCYRLIFAKELPDTDFISVGNTEDVKTDRMGFNRTIQTLMQSTKVIRLIDKDDNSDEDVAQLQRAGIRVLTQRHLESYLMSDEVLTLFCHSIGRSDALESVLKAKEQAIDESALSGKQKDDVKSAASGIYVRLKTLLDLRQYGGSHSSFMQQHLINLIAPGTETYTLLKKDIFGE